MDHLNGSPESSPFASAHIHVLHPPDSLLWMSADAAGMEQYAALASAWLPSMLMWGAWIWVIYRASQVLSKPTDELISLLGIETPVAPTLSLAGIKADGVALHWKAGGDQKPSTGTKYSLYVNGIRINDNLPESPITVTGLQPDHGYVIRIFAVNSLSFVATSDEILVQTRPSSSNDFYVTKGDDGIGHGDGDATPGPKVKPYKALLETISQQGTQPQPQREHSGSLSHPQKRGIPRRQTNASSVETTPIAQQPTPIPKPAAPESEETIRQLTERLDKIRAETESYNEQAQAEEERFAAEYKVMEQNLHDVQQQVRDRQEASKKLKEQVNTLQSEEAAVKKSKATIDKQLQAALQERERMRRDMAKWAAEGDGIEQQIKQMAADEQDYKVNAAKEVEELRETLAAETATNKSMEENIRQLIAEVKGVEDSTRVLESEIASQDAEYAEGEAQWRTRMAEAQNQYMGRYQQLLAARQQNQLAQAHLDQWKQYYYAHQAAQVYPQAPQQPLDALSPHRESLRRRRTHSLNMRDDRSPPTSHAELPGATFIGTSLSTSPRFGTVSSFFNLTNGMTIPSNSIPMSPDVDGPGAAPTSPSAADGLLPSGLFGDEAESSRFTNGGASRRHRPLTVTVEQSPSPLNSSLNQHPNVLPGLGAPEILEELNQGGPSSPASIQSRSQNASAFTSPQQSLTHLPLSGSALAGLDADRRSVHSLNIASRSSAGGKLSSFFHLKRGKPGSDEGPALGEFGSLPRQESAPEGSSVLPHASAFSFPSRRRGSAGGAGAASAGWVGGLLGRANTSASLGETTATAPGSSGPVAQPVRRRFGMFGANKQLEDDERPSSTASLDSTLLALPRPGLDTQTQSRFGWPISFSAAPPTANADTLTATSNSVSGTNLVSTDWSVPGSTPGWRSRLHSRTNSTIGGGPPGQGLVGLTATTPDDSDLLLPPGSGIASHAPIGTRPRSAHVSRNSYSSVGEQQAVAAAPSSTPPKLNPTAPAFRLFGSANGPASSTGSAQTTAETPPSTKRSLLRLRPLSEGVHKASRSIDDTLDSPLLPPPLDSPSVASSSRRSRDGEFASSLASSVADMSEIATRDSLDSGKGERETFMQKVARKSSQSLGTLTTLPKVGGRKARERKGKAAAAAASSSATPVKNAEEDGTDHENDEEEATGGGSGARDKEQDAGKTPVLGAAASPAPESSSGGRGKGFRLKGLRKYKGRDRHAQHSASASTASSTAAATAGAEGEGEGDDE